MWYISSCILETQWVCFFFRFVLSTLFNRIFFFLSSNLTFQFSIVIWCILYPFGLLKLLLLHRNPKLLEQCNMLAWACRILYFLMFLLYIFFTVENLAVLLPYKTTHVLFYAKWKFSSNYTDTKHLLHFERFLLRFYS